MRSDEQRKKDDEAFKLEVKKEKQQAKKAEDNVKIGLALDFMRSRINQSVFRKVQSNQEVKGVAVETLILRHWLTVNFGYNHEKAIKSYKEDAEKLRKKLYEEGLRKVK